MNFPSPSVIVSIATAVRSNSNASAVVESPVTSSPTSIPTRYLGSADRDELIRNAGVVLGSGLVPASSFLQLANALVQLGAKHGAGLVEDLGLIFNSPNFEAILPGISQEYRNHFVEEARNSSGIGLVISVRPGSLLNVTMGMSYCVDGPNSAFLRHVPLRHAQLTPGDEPAGRVSQLVYQTLKEERLDHMRRSIVCNSLDMVKEVFTGQMAVPCVGSLLRQVLVSAHTSCPSKDWQAFYNAIQRVANLVQSLGWESQLGKPVRPVGVEVSALDWMELVINTSTQYAELYKASSVHDTSVWGQLDRTLLGHVAAFLTGIKSVASKLTDGSCPTLCNVLPSRSHLVSLCTPKPVDPPALSAFKYTVMEAVSREWPLEMIHRLACVLHPAFKQMRRLDISDRERTETYAFLRNLLRSDAQQSQSVSEHILRNALDGSSNKNGEVKRKAGRNSNSNNSEPGAKRQKTSSAAPLPSAPIASTPNSDAGTAFEFSDLADFNLVADPAASSGGMNGTLVPERDELDLYLEEKVIQQDLVELTNVLVYWKHRQNVFPVLSQLAFWLLSLPADANEFSSPYSETANPDTVLQRSLLQVVAQSNSSPSNVVD